MNTINTSTSQTSWVKIHQQKLVVGGACLVFGFISGILYEKWSWSRSYSNQILQTISQTQQNMRRRSAEDDIAIKKQLSAFEEDIFANTKNAKNKNSKDNK